MNNQLSHPIDESAAEAQLLNNPATFSLADFPVTDNQIILIPYIEQETGVAEVWIGRAHRNIARVALADFAGLDARDADGILAHCRDWHADRILLPTSDHPVRWTAYTIASVLVGQREEAR